MTGFGWDSTADNVLDGIDLAGRRALVTGVSAGLGLETAHSLWAHGAEVLGAARNLAKARKVAADVSPEFSSNLTLIELDLASLASVQSCAEQLLQAGRPIDLIIANAGIMMNPFELTVDGYESQFAVNCLGHFLLINRLFPLVTHGGRVVTLSSVAHHLSDFDIDDMNFAGAEYDPIAAYAASKTAVILFTVELDRRLRDRGIRATSVHPGNIPTELLRFTTPQLLERLTGMFLAEAGAAVPRHTPRQKTVAQGAATTVWAGVVAPAEEVGGRYCEDCHVGVVAAEGSAGVRPYAVDPERARLLWARSEEMLGDKFL